MPPRDFPAPYQSSYTPIFQTTSSQMSDQSNPYNLSLLQTNSTSTMPKHQTNPTHTFPTSQPSHHNNSQMTNRLQPLPNDKTRAARLLSNHSNIKPNDRVLTIHNASTIHNAPTIHYNQSPTHILQQTTKQAKLPKSLTKHQPNSKPNNINYTP